MVKRWFVIMIALVLAASFVEAVSQHKVVMSIEGMTCKLCTVAVKKSLSKVEGVHTVEVSLKEKKAWLTIDESVTDETLVKAVQKAGYKGKVIKRETLTDDPEA